MLGGYRLRREAWPLAAGPADPPPGRGVGLGQGPAPGSWAGWPLGRLPSPTPVMSLPISEFLVSGSFSLNPHLALLSALGALTPKGIGAIPGFRIQALSPPGCISTHSRVKPQYSEERTSPKYRPPSPPREGGRRSSAPVGEGPGGRQGEQSPSSSRWLKLWKSRRPNVSELGGWVSAPAVVTSTAGDEGLGGTRFLWILAAAWTLSAQTPHFQPLAPWGP